MRITRARLRALAVIALLAVGAPAHAAGPLVVRPCDLPDAIGRVTIDLGTGEQNGVPDPIGSVDGRWKVAPSGADAYSVAPNAAWVTVPDANWINQHPTNASTGTTPVRYRTTFVLPPEVVQRSLGIDFAADNGVTFYLNGNPIGGYDPPAGAPWPDALAAFHQLHHLTYAGPFLQPVQNTLDAVVSDDGTATGLLVRGEVAGCATRGADPTTCVQVNRAGGVVSYSPAPIAVGTSVAWSSGFGGTDPVYAISSPAPWYVPTPPATWISVTPTRQAPSLGTHYEYTFNLPNDFAYGGIVLRFAADDEAVIRLNDATLTATANQPGWNHEESFALANAPLHAGPNTIAADVADTQGNLSGLLVEAEVYACRGKLPDIGPVDRPGVLCQAVATDDPTAEPNTQTGVLSGGPLVLAGSGGLQSGTLTCRVQVNVSNHTGVGPQVQGHGTGVVTAGPTQFSYVDVTNLVYLCAEFTDDRDGTTYYWDDTNGAWATSPFVDCGLLRSVDGATPSTRSSGR
jgi:hypothetical protein